MAESLLKHGMEVRNDDYYAFDVCVRNEAVDCAKLLIDHGFNLDGYVEWCSSRHHSHAYEETISALKVYRQSIQPEEQTAAEEQTSEPELTLGGLSK